jgi:hypothetical protein
MALTITGIFIQLLGLAVQFIQLWQGCPDYPGRLGEAAVAERKESK